MQRASEKIDGGAKRGLDRFDDGAMSWNMGWKLIGSERHAEREVLTYENVKTGARKRRVRVRLGNSRGGTSSRGRERWTGGMPSGRHSGRVDTYGTSRDSESILERWPKTVPYDVVLAIEDGCRDLMKTFGYKFVGNRAEYSNKKTSYLPTLSLNSSDDTQ